MTDLLPIRHKLPMIFQDEISECGLACLAMIAGYFGKGRSLRALRKTCQMAATGASVKQLMQAAETMQLRCRPLKFDIEDLSQLSLPVILHWDMDHFVVLNKLSRNHIVIHDPAVGVRKYRKQELGIHITGIAIEVYPQSSFSKEAESPQYSLTDLFQPTPSFKRAITQVFALSLLIQLLSLSSPLYLQLVIDQGLVKGDMELVLLLAVLFFMVIVAKSLAGYFRGIVLLQFSNQLGFQIIGTTFSHLLSLPLSYFEKREMGDIVSRFSSLENIKQLVTQDMVTVIVDGLFSLITLLLLFLYSPMLAVITIVFVSIFAGLRFALVPLEKSRRQEVLVTNATQQSRFMENIRSIVVTKNYAIEKERETDWQGDYADYINSGYKLGQFQLGMVTAQGLVFGLDNIITIYLGSSLVYEAELTIGQLLSFIFLKQHFANSISAMLPKLAEIRLMKLDLERIADITLEKPECSATTQPLFKRNIQGNFEVDGLCFRYSAEGDFLINDLSFSLGEGQSLAILGKSGCGKSTLLKLLLKLEKCQSGDIRVGGINLDHIDTKLYREHVSAIMHGDTLLSGDLSFNINLGNGPLNENRLLSACTTAGIYDEICALPMGFNTQVGEMGNAFSAGQIQRLLLARAIYRQPKILLLDEALSHLNNELAEEIFLRLADMNVTVILATHNPNLARHADIHLLFDKSANSCG